MPKDEIDYSNTLFYKIYCKDTSVKDIYIGHTTNFVQRKYVHKQSCNTEKHANHNLKVYKCIRNNGGWNNWRMDIIGFHECYDHYEARKIEQNYFETLHATLNSIEPLPKPKQKPISIPKEETEKPVMTCDAKKFRCIECDFKCCNKKDFKRHLATEKHKMMTNDDTKPQKSSKAHICECGKSYKYRQGLSVHRKKSCTYTKDQEDNKVSSSSSEPIVEYLLKENIEMKKTMIDLCKKIEPSSINNTNNANYINSNNTNNNIFNIQLFLNEDCKDAMNMTEFIESIQLTLEDMTKINLEGQTEGISKLLINKLQNIDILKRPMHCSDSKKEIIYVKDEDKWEKEGKDKSKIKKALDKITIKSIETLPNIKQDPDDYINTVNELLKEPREDKKIISKLAKEVCVK